VIAPVRTSRLVAGELAMRKASSNPAGTNRAADIDVREGGDNAGT
jgi:hypothetical protein